MIFLTRKACTSFNRKIYQVLEPFVFFLRSEENNLKQGFLERYTILCSQALNLLNSGYDWTGGLDLYLSMIDARIDRLKKRFFSQVHL